MGLDWEECEMRMVSMLIPRGFIFNPNLGKDFKGIGEIGGQFGQLFSVCVFAAVDDDQGKLNSLKFTVPLLLWWFDFQPSVFMVKNGESGTGWPMIAPNSPNSIGTVILYAQLG
jgi:hypothetical protein